MSPSIQHLALAVTDPERSAAYYGACLAPLGVEVRPARYTSDHGERPLVVAAGVSFSLMLHRADDRTPPDRYRIGLHHFAVRVPTIELVDQVAEAARGAGGRVTDGPRHFREYRFGYYGVFLRDPDDLKWEVFCYSEPAAR